jgi:eukaryotic-like serine/threonine-protein kinase
MSVPTSVEELLQLIRKSGMIEENKLSGYMQRRQFTRGLPADVREFTDEMIRDGVMTSFQAEQFLLGKWRGFTIGKYKLLERVGVGGMGQVFLCEHMFMKKRVAIKVLPPAKAEQPAALGRFYREARAAGSLEHPNIVRTHDIDQDGNLHFIVMDYVDGPNLLDVVKKNGQMDIGRAVSYTRQVATALDYAFRNKIIHRDIKPGNVLIDRKGVARILDLGLARFINDHSDQLTLKYDDKIVLGTADYVAPEQVANSHSVDIRADLYAMGATFYFLLAGHPPFPTGTVSQKLLWHRTKEPTAIRAIRPEIPDGLAAIVAKLMAKDPKARYQTPAQVVADLEAWIPAIVPLPNPDEMPQLSPAAMEGVPVECDDEEQPVVGVASETARTENGVATAVLAEPKPAFAPPTPFGPSPGSPWGGAGSDDVPVSTRHPVPSAKLQSANDTIPAPSEQTPSGQRRNPFLNANPFAGGDASEVANKPTSRSLIAAIVIVIVATIALVVTKL